MILTVRKTDNNTEMNGVDYELFCASDFAKITEHCYMNYSVLLIWQKLLSIVIKK